MKTITPFETWQMSLPRRVATLARMHPLHRFEAAKASRNLDLGMHDLRTLSLMVFDAVIERMGLAAGATKDEIIGALKPIIVAAETNADIVRVTQVATMVLDFLMNEKTTAAAPFASRSSWWKTAHKLSAKSLFTTSSRCSA